jgi:Virulence-associated protein E-like domain
MADENQFNPLVAPGSSMEGVSPEASSEEVRVFVTLGVEESIDRLLADWGYDVLFDGTWVRLGMPQQADNSGMVESFLDVEPLAERDVLDELVLYVMYVGVKLSSSLLKAGLRKVARRRKKDRKKAILKPLLSPVEFSADAAEKQWSRWGELFDMPRSLAINCGRHAIWQVKRKALNRSVQHHLMLVVYGAEQGSGKTTLVRRFASPLAELASADVLLSDFADHRSGDIYRYSLVITDDMEQLPKAAVPALKSLITANRISRRQLQTSNSTSTRQAATLIGTANRPVHQLIEDDTGHRRFVMMPFRNGNHAKGGDRKIWEIVNSLDFELLWQSVDAFGPSPIMPSIGALHSYQNGYRPTPKLLRWLRELDLNSQKMKAISVHSGVRSDQLRDLYVKETGDVISRQRFADEMLIHMADESVPFFEKFKKEIGAVYRVRAGFEQQSTRSAASSSARQSDPSESLSFAASSIAPSDEEPPEAAITEEEVTE